MSDNRHHLASTNALGAAVIALVAIAAAMSAFALTQADSEVHSMFTVPASVVAFAACSLGLAGVAAMRMRTPDPRAALQPLAVAVGFAAWFAAIAAMSWWVGVEGLRGPFAVVLIAIAGSMHVPILTLLQWSSLAGVPRVRRLLLVLAVPTCLLSMTFTEPTNPWGQLGPAVDTHVGAIVSTICTTLWILVVLAAPIILWRRAAHAPSELRHARFLAAVAATMPLLGVGVSTVTGALLGIGGDIVRVGSGMVVGLCASSLVATICASQARSAEAQPAGEGSANERRVVRRASLALILGAVVPPALVVVAVSAAGVARSVGGDTIATTFITLVGAGLCAAAVVPIIGWMVRVTGIHAATTGDLTQADLMGADRLRADPERPDQVATDPAFVPASQTTAPATLRFTQREHAVAMRLARGFSNAAIARELVVSERTVHAHVRAIYAKLGLPADGEHNQRVTAANAIRGTTAEMPMPSGVSGP